MRIEQCPRARPSMVLDSFPNFLAPFFVKEDGKGARGKRIKGGYKS